MELAASRLWFDASASPDCQAEELRATKGFSVPVNWVWVTVSDRLQPAHFTGDSRIASLACTRVKTQNAPQQCF
jgi:hypothetical protein